MNRISQEQKLGFLVNLLRRMRESGARAQALVSAIEDHHPVLWVEKYEYLVTAFCSSTLYMLGMMAEKDPDNQAIWAMIDDTIDSARPAWQLQSFPELMRVRDYVGFLQFTKDNQLITSVCASNPDAGRWIGRHGMRCYGGRMFVASRQDEPNAGMLAADPSDTRLQAAIRAYAPAMSYPEYVLRLNEEGLRVCDSEAGYVLEDRQGNRLHEGYWLHGVYCAKTYEPVWTGRRGDILRANLNQHLGHELVHVGPHDHWEHRNNMQIAGPLFGPSAPIIEFANGEKVRNLLSIRAIADQPQYLTNWAELYPEHVATKET